MPLRLAPLLPLLLIACRPPGIAEGPGDGQGDTGEPYDTDDEPWDSGDTGQEPDDTGEDPLWQGFFNQRQDFLLALAEPIAACVQQNDTSHPAFHGCIDWHSAVHGNWSLHAISRLTGDESYREIASSVLDEQSLVQELVHLQTGSITNEIPYGYAWFLTLAREREAAGYDDLVPLAEVVTQGLLAHVLGLAPARIESDLLDDDYDNLSWALLNLWQQAQHLEDEELSAWVEEFVLVEVLPRAVLCPLSACSGYQSDFFPPCLHLARLLLTCLPQHEREAWLETALEPDFDLQPLENPQGAHAAGLNFSRSWGLLALWQATGSNDLRDIYVDHIETHMAMPQYWAEDYYSYSHWVAQFGVYGIALSYE